MDRFADFPHRKKKKTIDPAALAAHRVRLHNLVLDPKSSISHIEVGLFLFVQFTGMRTFWSLCLTRSFGSPILKPGRNEPKRKQPFKKITNPYIRFWWFIGLMEDRFFVVGNTSYKHLSGLEAEPSWTQGGEDARWPVFMTQHSNGSSWHIVCAWYWTSLPCLKQDLLNQDLTWESGTLVEMW